MGENLMGVGYKLIMEYSFIFVKIKDENKTKKGII